MREKVIKSFITFVLACTLALSLAIPSFAAYGTGVIELNGDSIWMGWSHFESSSEGYAQAGGDGGHAYGRYQFDIGYDFVDFMKMCVQAHPDHYADFNRFIGMSVITKGRGSSTTTTENFPLLEACPEISDLWKSYASTYGDEFYTLQDEYMYRNYYLAAKNNLKAAGIDLNAYNNARLNGTVWSIAVRDGSGISNLKAITGTYQAGQSVDVWLDKIYDAEAAKHTSDKERWQTSQREACKNLTDYHDDGGTSLSGYVRNRLWSLFDTASNIWAKISDLYERTIGRFFKFPIEAWYKNIDTAAKITDKNVSAQTLIAIIDDAVAAAYGSNYSQLFTACSEQGLDYGLTASTYTTNGNALNNIDYAYIMSVYSVGENYYDTTLEQFREDMINAMKQMTTLTIEKKTTTVIEGVPFYKYKSVNIPVCSETKHSRQVPDGTDEFGNTTYTTEYYKLHSWTYKDYFVIEKDGNGQPIVDFRITSENGQVVPDYQLTTVKYGTHSGETSTSVSCPDINDTYYIIGPGDGTAGEGERTDMPIFIEKEYGDVVSSALSNSELWNIFGIDKDGGYFTDQAHMLKVDEDGNTWADTTNWDQVEKTDFEVTNLEVAQIRYREFTELYGEAFSMARTTYRKGLTEEEIKQYLAALPADLSGNRKQVVKTALALVHQVPYCNNGSDSKPKQPGYDPTWYDYTRCDALGRPSGLDSSGFVQWAFWTAGFSQDEVGPLMTTSLISNTVDEIPYYEDILPGDIGLVQLGITDDSNELYNRVGIYLGNGQWIVNSSTDGTVVISSSENFSSVKVFSERMENDDLYSEDIIFYGTGIAELGDGDLYTISQIILAECGDPANNAMAAFAEMIKNRAVDTTEFADVSTIWDVLMQDGAFSSVSNNSYKTKRPSSRQLDIILQVFDGKFTALNNAHVFYAEKTKTHTNQWGKPEYPYSSLEVFDTFGDMTYYIKGTYQSATGQTGLMLYSNSNVDLTSYSIPGNGSCNPVVYMAQGDFSDVAYGNGSVATCGCGVVATAMAVSYCMGGTDKNHWVSPQEVLGVIEKATGSREGCYSWGKGSNHDIAAVVAGNLGLRTSGVLEPSSLSEADVLTRLKSGQVAVCSAGKGYFPAGSGHFITITGCDNRGGIYVNDPNGSHASYSYNSYTWDFMLDTSRGHLTSITFISPK